MEKIWTRVPVVTANWSEGRVTASETARGVEMWVIGLLEGEAIWSCDLNVRQYVCSGVRLDGPGGSLTACKGSTGAAILALYLSPMALMAVCRKD